MSIVCHPAWVANAGVDDIARHFQVRGYEPVIDPASRYLQIAAKLPRSDSVLREITNLFRPNPQRNR